ncbi:alpha/beta fold hydrolase [Nocardia sp. NPDC049149]|uniref:alpha/beta fold hydrolase n=1 Tax=Nocardia sp. NPDC049149 TaxID=3364315 RepID=UPI003724B8A9
MTARREYRFPRPGGVWLHITEWGAPIGKVTVLLLHGWGLSSRSWEDVAELLVRADPALRVIAYDHRGHGLSARTRASLEMLADDLADVVTDLAPSGPVVFGGHSMGGMTLMTLAERHPELVRSRTRGVAMVATGAGELPATGRALLLRFPALESLVAGLIARTRMPARPLFLLRQLNRFGMFGANPRRHDLTRVVWQAAQAHPRAVADMGSSMLRHNRFHVLAGFAAVETVILAGTRDTITPVRYARALAAQLPDARLIEYPGSGHQLPYERREEITEHLHVLCGAVAPREEVAV